MTSQRCNTGTVVRAVVISRKLSKIDPQLLWKTGVEVGTDDYVAAFIFSQAGSPGDIGYSGIKC